MKAWQERVIRIQMPQGKAQASANPCGFRTEDNIVYFGPGQISRRWCGAHPSLSYYEHRGEDGPMATNRDGRGRRVVIGLLLSSFLTVGAVDKGQPLNVKAGLWEVTTTGAAGKDVMLSAAVLEKLTPEQRARIEERIRASKSDAVKTKIKKQCLTREQLQRGIPFRPGGKSCTWTPLTSTSSELEMRGDCVDQGFKAEARLRIEALSPEQAEGSLQFLTNGENSTATTSTFKAKWIGPQCRTP